MVGAKEDIMAAIAGMAPGDAAIMATIVVESMQYHGHEKAPRMRGFLFASARLISRLVAPVSVKKLPFPFVKTTLFLLYRPQ